MKAASRLICKDKFRLRDYSAGNGHKLLLSAAKLVWE
jgi:hypothetical protein